MNIITFGSCLSRYIANAILRQTHKAALLNSVYHNRIDAFLANHIDNQGWLPPLETLTHGQTLAYREFSRLKVSNSDSPPQAETDDDAATLRLERVGWASNERPPRVPALLLNQYPLGLGLHHLQAGPRTPLLQTLQTQQADLILVDNYVDIGARLLQLKDNPHHQFFYNHGWLTQGKEALTLSPLLYTETAVDCWMRWLSLLKALQPKAQLVVAPFPYNAFASAHRFARARAFTLAWREQLAQHPELEAWMLPTYQVHRAYLNPKDVLHFNNAFYGVMAGSVLARMGRFKWLDAHNHDISLDEFDSVPTASQPPKQLAKRFWHRFWS
jgi:hypothetical protein